MASTQAQSHCSFLFYLNDRVEQNCLVLGYCGVILHEHDPTSQGKGALFSICTRVLHRCWDNGDCYSETSLCGIEQRHTSGDRGVRPSTLSLLVKERQSQIATWKFSVAINLFASGKTGLSNPHNDKLMATFRRNVQATCHGMTRDIIASCIFGNVLITALINVSRS